MSLATFDTADKMYLARKLDVNPNRPIFTGDVFDSISIPGIQSDGLAMVTAHPCSMRGANAQLKERILIAAVEKKKPIEPSKWEDGFFGLTPLPELINGSFHVGNFNLLGQAKSTDLVGAKRLACLSLFGVNLLQQRLIWYLTRFEVPTYQLEAAFVHSFEETDPWVQGVDATHKFDQFIREKLDKNNTTLQKNLREPRLRSSVRKACMAQAREIVNQLNP